LWFAVNSMKWLEDFIGYNFAHMTLALDRHFVFMV